MAPDQMVQYKAGDTSPPIEDYLEQKNPVTGGWEPMDLGAKTIRLLARNRRTGRTFGGDVTVVDADTAHVRYDLQPGDLTEGDYYYEYEATAPNGSRRTIPRGSYREIQVRRKQT